MSRFVNTEEYNETWYGFDKNGRVIETFYGSFGEAVDYFNSNESSPRVERFDRLNEID